jgi:hypothetical protein
MVRSAVRAAHPDCPQGEHRLMARLPHGSGLRLMDCVRLRAKFELTRARTTRSVTVPLLEGRDPSPRAVRTAAYPGAA